MNLSCVVTVALLLAANTQAYFYKPDLGPNIWRDVGHHYSKELPSKQQLKHYMRLLDETSPVTDFHSDNDEDNYIANEPVLVEDKTWHELHQQKMYEAMRVRSENPFSGSDNVIGDSSLDEIVDFLLGLVSKEIVARGKDQIPVPNMSEEFEKRVAFVKLHGKFDAQNGWFKNLSTIARTGDVLATRRGSNTLVITGALGLSTMQFGYDSYQANLAGISVRGHMTGSVASNSITVQVAASFFSGKCNVTLEELKVDRFDGLQVELTGLGAMSWLLDSIVGWATQHFKDDIVSSVEENISKVITDVISKYHCSELAELVRG